MSPPAPLPQALHWRGLGEAQLAAHLQRLARWLRADAARADLLITLHGELGTGKTTFVRHLLQALGVGGRIKSPTFAIVEPYQIELGGKVVPAWHADLYRFDDPREWAEAGLQELCAGGGLRLIEWPERAGSALANPDLTVRLSMADDDHRDVEIIAGTAKGLDVLNALQTGDA